MKWKTTLKIFHHLKILSNRNNKIKYFVDLNFITKDNLFLSLIELLSVEAIMASFGCWIELWERQSAPPPAGSLLWSHCGIHIYHIILCSSSLSDSLHQARYQLSRIGDRSLITCMWHAGGGSIFLEIEKWYTLPLLMQNEMVPIRRPHCKDQSHVMKKQLNIEVRPHSWKSLYNDHWLW